jgi:hypothetical protein
VNPKGDREAIQPIIIPDTLMKMVRVLTQTIKKYENSPNDGRVAQDLHASI